MHPLSGEQGETRHAPDPPASRGVTSKTARAIVFLFLLAFVTAGLSLMLTIHYVNSQQAAQRQQGLLVEHSICTTLAKLAALKPPPGSAVANPSRAYEQRLHATLDQLSPDLGCKP
jgi:hypothetical protein